MYRSRCSALLAFVIIQLLIAGPIKNSINNGEIGGKQAICLYNQSKLTLQQVQSDIKEEWNGTIETFKKFTGTWKGILKELSEVIKKIKIVDGNPCGNGSIEFQFNIKEKRYWIDACYLTNNSVPIVPKMQIIHQGPKITSSVPLSSIKAKISTDVNNQLKGMI